jgi:glycosyltransferase involved in cell wall biosynthesis
LGYQSWYALEIGRRNSGFVWLRFWHEFGSFSDVEVIVIDNGSTDNTKEVVNGLAAESRDCVRYVFEPIAGLCQARNRGRSEAKGSVLAYIDDDVVVGDEWVKRVRQHFIEQKSDCLGGRVTATLDGELAFQMDDSMLWFFQATSFGDKPRDLEYPEHPIGCNMAFTTEVFDAVGGFETALKLYATKLTFFAAPTPKASPSLTTRL